MVKQNVLLIIVIAITGSMILFISTDQFQAFTAEQARRASITNNTPLLTDVTFQDSEGDRIKLSDYQGKYVLATYMYTACGDVCPAIERNFLKIYKGLPEQMVDDELQLLSISFDPVRDTPEQLQHAEEVFQADGENWKMVRIPDQQQLNLLLEQSGVIVIPAEDGFEHNAAFYLIDPNGRLVRIFNYDLPNQVVEIVSDIVGAKDG
ncbi:SCO family protein [Aquibacillus sediminis]|uniref:SCO family protein n=1 Tax=Aquibacillus sediminis TaxID=2574734 RepID=UPI0011081E2C|nr:SCO family protein [Aquibacillus sediminis]